LIGGSFKRPIDQMLSDKIEGSPKPCWNLAAASPKPHRSLAEASPKPRRNLAEAR